GGEGEYARGGRGAAASSQHVAGDRLLPEPLACAGPGTVECGTGAVLFAAFEALSLSQSSPTRPPTALVPGVGPVPLPGNTCLGGLPLSGGLSSRLWGRPPSLRLTPLEARLFLLTLVLRLCCQNSCACSCVRSLARSC